jgi:hypothetical protein
MNSSNVAARIVSVAVNTTGLYVAVGYTLSNAPLYATSTDGSTWTTPALMNGSTSSARMNSVTVNNSGPFVAVGQTNSVAPVYAVGTVQ